RQGHLPRPQGATGGDQPHARGRHLRASGQGGEERRPRRAAQRRHGSGEPGPRRHRNGLFRHSRIHPPQPGGLADAAGGLGGARQRPQPARARPRGAPPAGCRRLQPPARRLLGRRRHRPGRDAPAREPRREACRGPRRGGGAAVSGGPVAFYAPLKAPDDATPSGDRRMAQLLLAALERAGYRPEIACRLRTFDGAGDRKIQERLRAEGEREAERLIAEYGTLPPAARPRVWFTYHVYYKAPDWTGPRVAAALGIPYAVAEGSRAAKRAGGPWALGHEGAERALDAARLVFVMTENDR